MPNRWCIGVFCAIGTLNLMAPEAAHAGGLDVTVHVRGQGAVTATGGFRCESANPSPDADGATCRYVEDAPGVLERVFSATPASTPAGNWVFGRWSGCSRAQAGSGECRVTTPADGAVVLELTAHFDDVRPPRVTLAPAAVSDRGATFEFSADEPAGFDCRIDHARAPCTSPVDYALEEGPHVFRVRATDPAGHRSESEALHFTVVDTAITSGPPHGGREREPAAEFRFRSRAGDRFECRLDGGALSGGGEWSTCVSPVVLEGLQEGVHRFAVRARAGSWIDPVPAIVDWEVDRTPPETVIEEGPREDATTDVLAVRFRVSSPGERSAPRFECRLDDNPFFSCADGVAVLTALEPGVHTFRARARDAAGNLDPTPVLRRWTSAYVDRDGDRVGAALDCNDGNPAIYPGAFDTPDDGVDQDCDGAYASNPPVSIGVVDADGDGVAAALDCNDGNPAVHPGAFDNPADGVDQDCDGVYARNPTAPASPVRTIATRLTYVARPAAGRGWRRSRATRIVRLVLHAVPARATVTVRCRGRGCARGATRVTRRPSSRLPLSRVVRRARLRPRAVVSVAVAHPVRIGRVWEIRTRRHRAPALSRACVAPGGRVPTAC